MDQEQFDTLTKALANRRSRRLVLGGAMAAIAGAVGVADAPARRGRKRCTPKCAPCFACSNRGKCQKKPIGSTCANGGRCLNGLCNEPITCRNGACASGDDCCSGVCMSGACQLANRCDGCSRNADCLSNRCVAFRCLNPGE